MTNSVDERTAPRVSTMGTNHVSYECGSDHTDGYRVTVGWSGDGYWVARASGVCTGDVIGTHDQSKEGALLDLACSLAATVDCLNECLLESEHRKEAS